MSAPGPAELVFLAVLIAVAVLIFRARRSSGSQSMKGAPQRAAPEISKPKQRSTEEAAQSDIPPPVSSIQRAPSRAPASVSAVKNHPGDVEPDDISTAGPSPSERMAVEGGGVFINYRRSDSEWPAGAMDAKLVAQFGRGRVFKDLDSIGLSENFWLNIEEGIERSEVMLSLIGPNWFNAENRARLEDPEDFVRREIETAYQKGVLVIPVWLSGARTPAEADLPETLRPLAKANAQDMGTNRDFDHRVERLIGLLQAKLER